MASLAAPRRHTCQLPTLLVAAQHAHEVKGQPNCSTPLYDVKTVDSGTGGARVRGTCYGRASVASISELQRPGTALAAGECISVSEDDFRRCGNNVTLLRKTAEKKKTQTTEMRTPWQTPTCSGAHSLQQSLQQAAAAPQQAEGSAEASNLDFEERLQSGLHEVADAQARAQKKRSYRLPGIQTILKDLDVGLPAMPASRSASRRQSRCASKASSSRQSSSRPPSSCCHLGGDGEVADRLQPASALPLL
eukprot:TRINITY_DN7879_c0_g3_i3.p1 TRINITY_DN7879_c0_g3~~TRINITY_DN7879_c0_g3_i3.p1  ORF type:complete len:249 (+),score=57.69 TRINITY_DN7879_c0_g3_i3:104-850(+)